MNIEPVTADRLDDLADLFNSNAATRGCWCMSFVLPRASGPEHYERRRGGNRRAFEAMAQDVDPPMGLLAYRNDTPVGWCATGPRSRYQRAIAPRGTILKQRDPAEDDDVWLVPCFFVCVGFRRDGITEALLIAAVALARSSGASAIEGWPIANEYGGAESFESREHVFAKCGFECVGRPSPRRAVMRRELGNQEVAVESDDRIGDG